MQPNRNINNPAASNILGLRIPQSRIRELETELVDSTNELSYSVMIATIWVLVALIALVMIGVPAITDETGGPIAWLVLPWAFLELYLVTLIEERNDQTYSLLDKRDEVAQVLASLRNAKGGKLGRREVTASQLLEIYNRGLHPIVRLILVARRLL